MTREPGRSRRRRLPGWRRQKLAQTNEADHRHAALAGEAFDPFPELPADLAQHRRRWDRVAAVEQEAHHLPLAHQLRHVALKEHAVN
jgi:hypothetical protein